LPSSGLFRVQVYDEHGMAVRTGSGIFARAVRDAFLSCRWRKKAA
jgi:uncharacterized protein YbbK (DUF523 family)